MIYTVNTLKSSTLNIPTSLNVNDEMLFNVTGTGTQGLMIMFKVPQAGTYEIELWGGNGSEGNRGNRALPDTTGGRGGGVRGSIAIAASDNLILIVGHAGYHIGNSQENHTNDGSTGGSGGGSFLFAQTDNGAFRIGSADYRLLGLAASGSGANDYGYQGTRTDGVDARNLIRDRNWATASTTIQTYCNNLFAGTAYVNRRSGDPPMGSAGYGGFGGGVAADDTAPNAVGYDIASRAGSNYLLNGGTWLGVNTASDREFNGLVVFRLRALKAAAWIANDDFNVRNLAGQIGTLKGAAGIP